MKSYRFYGEEMEVLGQRLDAARKMLAGAKSAWARNYWQQNVDRLLFQWQQLPILHDGDAKVTIIPRWTVGYDYWEGAEEIGTYDILERMVDTLWTTTPDLTASWERNREKRLARAQ
jgi:hypothetical protein